MAFSAILQLPNLPSFSAYLLINMSKLINLWDFRRLRLCRYSSFLCCASTSRATNAPNASYTPHKLSIHRATIQELQNPMWALWHLKISGTSCDLYDHLRALESHVSFMTPFELLNPTWALEPAFELHNPFMISGTPIWAPQPLTGAPQSSKTTKITSRPPLKLYQ